MTNHNPMMKRTGFDSLAVKIGNSFAKMAGLIAVFGFLLGANKGNCGDAPSLTEYQVKALFLMNFTKYVEWPAEAFAQADSPFTIGVLGEDKFGDDLKKAVAGKAVNGRDIVIQKLGRDDDTSKCQILFVCASEKSHLGEILNKVKSMSVLTVGETEQFIQQEGIINFTKKEGKVRLEINLDSARGAKLQISSKLLNVADVVKGKTK